MQAHSGKDKAIANVQQMYMWYENYS